MGADCLLRRTTFYIALRPFRQNFHASDGICFTKSGRKNASAAWRWCTTSPAGGPAVTTCIRPGVFWGRELGNLVALLCHPEEVSTGVKIFREEGLAHQPY